MEKAPRNTAGWEQGAMVSRNHNNRSEKQKGHMPNKDAYADPEQGFSSDAGERSRGDGGGGAPKHQGQGQAGNPSPGQTRGHGGRP
jgi:hypothetical protein